METGRVFNHFSTVPLSHLHTAGGIGFRGIALPFVVGYVDVGYGERAPADVLRDVQAWRRLYGISGVMFDRVPSDAASTPRLHEYVTGARRYGASFVVGNPGVPPALAVDTV